jgi:4-amino-4-deoxy-L-arabinose transferase-like glycosyltransferase
VVCRQAMSDDAAAPTPSPLAVAPVRSPVSRVGAMLIALFTVALAWGAVQGSGLSLTPFLSKGEPREAIVVQDLLRQGNWILPRRNAVQLPKKPPLFYWLAALVARARGAVDEASVRLPSAVMSGVASVLVAAVATALYGAVAGTVSGLTLLTSFEWLRAATAARVDMTLAFGLTLAFVGLLLFRRVERRGWLVLFYAGCAWATLSKGIPGLAIPAFQVLLICVLLDRSLAFAWRLRPISGLVGVLAVTGAWYAAAAAQGGRAFISIVVNENFVRAVGAPHFALGHRHSVVYLIIALLAGLLPWTVLLPSAGLALWRDRRSINRWDPRLFSLLWIVAVFTPYAIAASKRGVYLLPLYPAVCLLIGWWAAQLVRGGAPARWLPRALTPIAWALAAVLAVLAILSAGQGVGLPLLDSIAVFIDPRAGLDLGAVAAADCVRLAVCLAVAAAAAAALACATALRRWGIALAAMVLCAAVVIIGARAVILPAVATVQTRRPFAAALRRVVAQPAELHTGESLDYGTIFYWGAALPEYDRASGAPRPRYLLMPERAWLHMPEAERSEYERVPGLRVEQGGNQGYVVLLQRTEADAEARRRSNP